MQGLPAMVANRHTVCSTMQLFYDPVCALALPTYNALYNAGSAGLQQQDRANQDVRGVAFALDTITLLPNWPEIAKISFIFKK